MSPTTLARPRHPAPYPKYVLAELELWIGAEQHYLGRPLRILDPMAGLGRIHDLPRRLGETVGVEIEPEWARQRKGTIVGDATALPAEWTATFDVVATSPCYGSRMADHHEAKDACGKCGGVGVDWDPCGCAEAPMLCPDCHSISCLCGGFAQALRRHNKTCPPCARRICSACKGDGLSRRYTYRHALGRSLHQRNAGQMQWGHGYRALHADVWREARRVLRPPEGATPGGLILVNVKNHMRDGAEQDVVGWHAAELRRQGFKIKEVRPLTPSRGIPHGANGTLRVQHEHLIVGRSTRITTASSTATRSSTASSARAGRAATRPAPRWPSRARGGRPW